MKKLYIERYEDPRNLRIMYNYEIKSLWQGKSFEYKQQQYKDIDYTPSEYFNKFQCLILNFNYVAWQFAVQEQHEKY